MYSDYFNIPTKGGQSYPYPVQSSVDQGRPGETNEDQGGPGRTNHRVIAASSTCTNHGSKSREHLDSKQQEEP
ncbi:hypothetical protein ElyMa_002548600 [Elysia marginata]|uniref:Uncharacterized protein n=1 Tax=Elysia marginata TaxID=1093978 RepID=A0AAV4GVD4_9GAST|nr:hypothetical protein ElyMa_002548600 [Elysia marginata]